MSNEITITITRSQLEDEVYKAMEASTEVDYECCTYYDDHCQCSAMYVSKGTTSDLLFQALSEYKAAG